MERQEFNAEYVARLTAGDPLVENHFASYFGELVRIKLCRHNWSHSDMEDVRQETLLRVLQTLRQKGGLEHPERLGAFVNSVCKNIILELCRAHARHSANELSEVSEPADGTIDMDGALLNRERKELVRAVLEELPEMDRDLLRGVFLDESARGELCRKMNVDRAYLRVLLHRAISRFKIVAIRTGALATR